MRAALLTLVTTASLALLATPASAQGRLMNKLDTPGAKSRGAEYDQPIGRFTPTMIIQQKAQARAAERIGRIESAKWYGHSVARPRTNSTPFTGLYGAQFQGQLYGRPGAHFATRPVIYLTR